jgi:CBS domain-containing protein
MIHPATIASDLMTTKLVTLSPCCDVFSAIDLLLKNRISGAPVVDEAGDFLGVFSERSAMEVVVNAL